ncbi:MAG: hypothetical protein CSYNP_03337 [Syntrophus sp. SKADARSKE-3]|nr:hypothetical protein [Syntrophus sp. SKADARSKE-3]
MTKCPRCGSDRIKRSHTRGFKELLMKYFQQRAYRCINCGWRGPLHGKSSNKVQKGKYTITQLIFIGLAILVTIIIVFYVLMHEEAKPPIAVGMNSGPSYAVTRISCRT